jgi:O-6-methylguanine DNA methyltransferase
MNQPYPPTDREAAALASLAVPAPSSLRPAVLVEIGLADHYDRVDTPLGPIEVSWTGRGFSTVDLAGDDGAFEAHHLASTGRRAVPGTLPARLAQAIRRRLDGDRRVRVPLDLRGHSAFEQDVWRKALDIPRGEVRPYGWVAAEIGRPRAVRAVGTALGHNPVPLIVPCHRVVRTDGSIGQYSLGGAQNKRAVLSAEGLDPDLMEDNARRGERLVGCASTHIVCWPTCRTGRHMLERNRRPFRSLAEAGAAGYRPCKVCRPVAVSAA